jgi:PAS domain S-box-containing protein
MAPPPERPAALASLWRPHPSVEGEAAQQQARLAAGLLLALVPLCALALLLPGRAGAPWVPSGRWLLVELAAVLLAAYAIVRRGHVTSGVLVALVALEAAVWASRWNAGVHGEGEQALTYLAIPVLLAGFLTPVRAAAALAAGTVLAAWGLEAAVDRRLGSPLDSEDLGLGVLLLAVGVVAVVASAMAARQARRLDESAALLRLVTENLPEVLFVVDADGQRMRYINPSYEAVTGRRVGQAMADPLDWLQSVHPDDLERVKGELAAGRPTLEYRILHPTGDVREVRARTFPVPGPGGKPFRLVGIVEDVTAVRLAERAVAEAQAQRTHLLQQLAHDLASPLSPVKIQVRLREGQVTEPGRPGLAIVKRNVEHLQRLVEDMRDVVRVEGGGLRLARQPVDLADLARQAVETLRPAAAERGVRLEADAPGAVPVLGDAGRLTQVLYNLVTNALKFTPPGGRVDVRAEAREREAVASVQDSGNGMRPEQLERLFKAFSQVHDPGAIQRPEDRGTGLGLYISKGIVEAHGGTIRADSDGPGQGSNFTLRLPLAGPN